jgi:hypothetical protein
MRGRVGAAVLVWDGEGAIGRCGPGGPSSRREIKILFPDLV